MQYHGESQVSNMLFCNMLVSRTVNQETWGWVGWVFFSLIKYTEAAKVF